MKKQRDEGEETRDNRAILRGNGESVRGTVQVIHQRRTVEVISNTAQGSNGKQLKGTQDDAS
jgi:hypothetical protein